MQLNEKQLREASLILSRAKIAMLDKHPFYAHILTRLQFEFVEELQGGSPSATNGKKVFIVPDAFLSHSKGEQVTMLAHEQMHCLDGHLWRCGSRDAQWANVAQDIYIYHVLRSEGFETLKQNEAALTKILHQHARKNVAGYTYDLQSFEGQFWEQIYEAIVPPSSKQPSQQSGGDSDDSDGEAQPGGGGQSGKQMVDGCGNCYEPAKSPADAKEAREDWKEWIRQAGMYAKMAGARPGRWQELVEAATPQIPFEAHFYEFLKRGLGGDASYEAFNRRYISRGDYLPTETVEPMGETVLVNDTSGSRTTEDLAYAYGVFRAWRAQHPCRVHCVDADTECAAWRTFDEWDEMPTKWEAKGRGGTEFDAPFKQVTERHLEPVALIYFTDGFNYGDFAPKPAYEVLWVLTGEYDKNFKPPYGTVVPVKNGKEE